MSHRRSPSGTQRQEARQYARHTAYYDRINKEVVCQADPDAFHAFLAEAFEYPDTSAYSRFERGEVLYARMYGYGTLQLQLPSCST